jgi:hypothetical protein
MQKAFSLSPLRMVLAVGYSYMTFNVGEDIPFTSYYVSVFFMKMFWLWSNAYPASVDMIM